MRELKNAVLKLLKICNQVENFESQFLLNGPTNSFNSNGFELVLIYISGNSIKPEHLFLSGAKVLWRHRAWLTLIPATPLALWWEPGPAPCSSLNSDSPRAECITNARHQPPPNFTIMAAFWASKNNWKNCFQSQCYSFRQSFNEIESNDSDLKLFSYYRCVFCISSESETSKTDDKDVNFVVWEKIDELIDSGIYSFLLMNKITSFSFNIWPTSSSFVVQTGSHVLRRLLFGVSFV